MTAPISTTERGWIERLLRAMDDDAPVNDPPVPLDPCHECGSPAVRRVALNSYCSAHLNDLHAAFSPEAWINGGIGLQDGPLRPEFGPLEADLRCCCCGANWSGIPGDPCWWCRRAREIQADHQAELVLTPPDVDPDDATLEARYNAWRVRLDVAVQAGIISATRAENAWRTAVREVNRHAA